MTAKHRPTAETRAIVERAVSAGMTQQQVGQLLNLSDRSLRKHYRQELDRGALKVHAAIVGRLYDLAMGPDARVAYNACALWLKARCNWREADSATAIAMAKSESVSVNPVLVVPGQLSMETWDQMAAKHREWLESLRLSAQQPDRPQLTVVAKSAGPEARLAAAERRFHEITQAAAKPEWRRRRDEARREQIQESLKSGRLD